MKLKIVSPTGLVKDVKVVNAETNEMLDDVKEFTIHAKSNMGLVEVSIKFSRLAFEVTAEKKKRTKKPKYPDSTAYSKSCIEANKKTVMDGEGRVDLDYVENHGVNPNDRLSWYMWRYFIKIYSENKLTKIKVPDIVDFIRREFGPDQSAIEFKFDRTTANHCINKFCFIGLLNKHKKSDECFYTFSNSVKRRGLEWFLQGNKYMKGHFQSGAEGFFNLLEIKE